MDLSILKASAKFYFPISHNLFENYDFYYDPNIGDFIIKLGETYLNKSLSRTDKEILKYELQLNQLYFNKLENNYDYFVEFCTLSEQAAKIIFNINHAINVINYIDIYGEILTIEIENLNLFESLKNSDNKLSNKIIEDFFNTICARKKIDGHFVKNIFYKNKDKNHAVNLQWHITNKCENKCFHCYLQEEEKFIGGRKDELSFDEMKRVVNELYIYALENNTTAHITLSGGDPLLSKYFYQILEYANKTFGYNLITSILGNPDLIDIDIATNLYKLGIRHIQFSIDGLEKTNNLIRNKNSWNKVWNTIGILNQIGIKNNIMFTVSRKNYQELVPLIMHCAQKNITNLSFSRYCATCNEDINEVISPEEYRNLLFRVFETFRYYYQEKNIDRWDLSKESLYALLYKQIGIDLYQDKGGCCLLGNGKSIAMLPNGVILYCRRAPEKIGCWPNISIKEALYKQNKVRSYNNIEVCKDCYVKTSCRGGCAAINYRQSNSFDKRDIQCWK